MDKITLLDAMMMPPMLLGMVVAGEPDRPISVEMTYAKLFAIVEMLKEKNEDGEQ